MEESEEKSSNDGHTLRHGGLLRDILEGKMGKKRASPIEGFSRDNEKYGQWILRWFCISILEIFETCRIISVLDSDFSTT